jgi:hypothetical protein
VKSAAAAACRTSRSAEWAAQIPADRLDICAVALANPITWQVGLPFSPIGTGEPQRIAVETAAVALFSIASFAYAIRCLRPQE